LFKSSVAAETLPSELVDRTEVILLQQSDPVLFSLFERAEKGDERFFVKPGVLVRTWYDKFTRPECSRPTIVVPTSLRLNVLQYAHARHLGVGKTRSSLLQHICWPSIFRDTKNFCRHCDICQRLGKSKKPVTAPLQRPLVSKALALVATGSVGPLPGCTESSNRTIPADVLVPSPVIEEFEC